MPAKIKLIIRKDLMTKTKLALLGTAIAILISGGFYYAHAQNEVVDNSSQPKMMEKMVEDGIVTSEQANTMKEYAKNFRQEKRQQMMEDRISSAISNATITQDEATQIRDWLKNRPEAMKKLGPPEGKGMHQGGMMD